MIILLPDANVTLKNLENNFSKIKLHEITNKMSKYDVTVKLPRFKIEQSFELAKTLSKVCIMFKNQYVVCCLLEMYFFFVAWMPNNVHTSCKLY